MTENQALQNSYAAQLRGMFAEGAFKPAEVATRGAEEVDVQVLGVRATQFADTARQLGERNSLLLDSDRASERQGAEIELLVQIHAEVELASALLDNASPAENAARAATRSAGLATTVQTLQALADKIEKPVEQGAEAFIKVEPARGVEKQEDACRAIEDQVRRSLQTISRQTARAGSVALKTALTLDTEQLSKGVSIISSELGNAISQANAGLVDAVKNVIQTAARLLLQAYDWVLNLIGKDAESAMRKKVKEWVDDLQKDHVEGADDEPTLMERLVIRVYDTQKINDEVKGWTQNTQAEAQALMDTCAALQKLSAGYEVKAGQVQGACNAISKARTLALAASGVFPAVAGVLPYLELLSGAVSLGLLGYSLFSGYDYVDSGTVNLFKRFQIHFPDRVEGVRETAMKILVKA